MSHRSTPRDGDVDCDSMCRRHVSFVYFTQRMASIHCASGKFKTETLSSGTHVFSCVPVIVKKVRLHGSTVTSGCDETVVLHLKSEKPEIITDAKLTLRFSRCGVTIPGASCGSCTGHLCASSLCCPSSSLVVTPTLTFTNEGVVRTGTLTGSIVIGVSTQCLTPIIWTTTGSAGLTTITLPSFNVFNPSPPMLQIAADLAIRF